MNIFELYLDKIKSIIIELNKKGELLIPESFNGINAEIPPPKFDCDISFTSKPSTSWFLSFKYF